MGPRPISFHSPIPRSHSAQAACKGGLPARGPGVWGSWAAGCGLHLRTMLSGYAKPPVNLPPTRSSGEWELRLPRTRPRNGSLQSGGTPVCNPLQLQESPQCPPPTPAGVKNPHAVFGLWLHLRGGLCPSRTGPPEEGVGGTSSNFSGPHRLGEGDSKVWCRVHCYLGNHQFSPSPIPPLKCQAPCFAFPGPRRSSPSFPHSLRTLHPDIHPQALLTCSFAFPPLQPCGSPADITSV